AGTTNTHYSPPPAYGIEQVGRRDFGLFATRFPQLDLGEPVILRTGRPARLRPVRNPVPAT
ncbi:hypothetical protein, partial [Erythrobacter sp. YJ-T3-07]|uniref:hypothetical protein n=1 Tax=Erythrobacter sp. YJ-T3-07 TaxID=2793063 RepID=UPI001F475216